MIDPTFLDKYGAALGFSAIFLAMIGVLWSYSIGQREKEVERFDGMLKEQQTRYDRLVETDDIRYDKLQEKYLVDLAGGTAMNIRYTRPAQYDSEAITQLSQAPTRRVGSKTIRPNLTDEEIAQAQALIQS